MYDLENVMLNCLNNLKMSTNSTAYKKNKHNQNGMDINDTIINMQQLRAYLVVYIKNIFDQYDSNKQEGSI